ncbi:hypothetical protein HA48_15505 [Pantoea wallisii]|uniref:DUF5983 domain-containing protein n=1 Tax=Pantoea wallisii TaxID=1076551 RepID=A0A1X1D4M9_9GAMM|nr:DUF5983 family protein [Pantoea wallisii]ORM71471.1 hypothetical protein HA48_15505 [Pantoea wallisii]
MKISITDISGGINSSHEGYADLVADSVSFSLGRPLIHEEHGKIYDITERAISDAVQQLESSETDSLSKPDEPEICRCAVISNAHMTHNDSEILESLSPRLSGGDGAYHWIHPTRYGFLISLSASTDAIEEMRREGLSDNFCHVVTFLSEKRQVSMIHFDADADLLEGFNVHNW